MLLVGSVVAAGDNKDGAKSKRAYSLGYSFAPYTTYYEHDVINHAPIAPTVVAHAPVAEIHHAPAVVAHAPLISAVAPVSKVTSSIVSTNVHHYPASYYAPSSPIISSAPYYHAPAYTASSYVAPAYTASSYVAPAYSASSYVAPAYSASSYVAPAYTASYAAPAYAHSPLVTEFHRR